jgi:citrate lyase subunit beta/citryl-CoA lyase
LAKSNAKNNAARRPKAAARGSKGSTGEAGRKGDDVRSDLFVSVKTLPSGGIELNVTSRVDAMYGQSIRLAATSVISAYELTDARIDIDDKGALPFVIAARIEAALRRAGHDGHAPPERTVAKTRVAKDRLRRSRLYLPGNEPKLFINAGLHKPDGVILDLEDSVHPAEKDSARILVRNALRCVDFLGAERMVRINPSPLAFDDLEEIVPESPDLILVPKTETADHIRDIDQRIQSIQRKHSADAPIWLMPILESALGIENAFAIARASERVAGLTIGLEDYTADLGAPKTKMGDESLYARSRLVNAARAAGVQAIDSVFGDVGDVAALRAWATRARAMGFEGMGCIHPRQIRPIHESFTPTAEEIHEALAILAAFEEAAKKGIAVVSMGTRMIDPPVVERARRLVEFARRTGMVSDDPR